jgi:hypothetical protein
LRSVRRLARRAESTGSVAQDCRDPLEPAQVIELMAFFDN